jgi:hypothetical protein
MSKRATSSSIWAAATAGSGDGGQESTARAVSASISIRPHRRSQREREGRRVTHLVEFKLQDALKTDVSNATVVTTYSAVASNLKVRPIMTKQLKPARASSRTTSAWATGRRRKPNLQGRDRPIAHDLFVLAMVRFVSDRPDFARAELREARALLSSA